MHIHFPLFQYYLAIIFKEAMAQRTSNQPPQKVTTPFPSENKNTFPLCMSLTVSGYPTCFSSPPDRCRARQIDSEWWYDRPSF
jgi:hypothetical protein